MSILKTGVNVFLTGEPGSGKTHTINDYVAYLRDRSIEPAITASTGIAATHIGGMTIHSWSGTGIKTKLDKQDLSDIVSNDYVVERVRRAKVLIIDEISMLPPETLSMVDSVCRAIKKDVRAFGGLQIVLVGDFFQLPPVVKNEEAANAIQTLLRRTRLRFAYGSPAWTRAELTVCYLTEQYRQDDADFLNLLSAIRGNTFDNVHLQRVESRRIEYVDAPESIPKLFSHNNEVDSINNDLLEQLPGEPHEFVMTSQGPKTMVVALKKGCLSPETLKLKVDAVVMFTKNGPRGRFVNGTLGTVEGFTEEGGNPIVKTHNGSRVMAEPMDWTIKEYDKIKARITQLPLRLAWAITVHKSQGMSLDGAVIDLSRVFEFGQGYVALSRIRRFSGLYLLGWNERAFQVHPEALAKDTELRAASIGAKETFSKISPVEIRKLQHDFVAACGGKNISQRFSSSEEGGEPKTSFERIREKYPNAYRPWDKTQDETLRKLFTQGSPLTDLVKAFGRKRGAIKSRLAKLGLLEN